MTTEKKKRGYEKTNRIAHDEILYIPQVTFFLNLQSEKL